MTGTMRNLFISSKEFKAEALNVQGYDINQISLRKAKKEKFSEKLDVKVDMQQVLSALENKGYVYAFAVVKGAVPFRRFFSFVPFQQ